MSDKILMKLFHKLEMTQRNSYQEKDITLFMMKSVSLNYSSTNSGNGRTRKKIL